MNLAEEIKLYLPKWLSADTEKEFYKCITQFPKGLDDKSFYTEELVLNLSWIDQETGHFSQLCLPVCEWHGKKAENLLRSPRGLFQRSRREPAPHPMPPIRLPPRGDEKGIFV